MVLDDVFVIFRPPFINGRPQKTDFIFGAKAPVFEEFSPVFFICFIFKRESPGVTRGHQRSPGVTRGHQGETGGDQRRLGETGGD